MPGSSPPESVIDWRVAATSVGEVPRGDWLRSSSRSRDPSGPAIDSMVTAATIRPASGQLVARSAAPWPPLVPPSEDTSTTPRRSLSGASTRPSSISIAEPATGWAPTPSRRASTAMMPGCVPGL